MELPNIQCKCIDCGTTFEITVAERAWYDERGWVLPKRCKNCRKAKKANKSKKANK